MRCLAALFVLPLAIGGCGPKHTTPPKDDLAEETVDTPQEVPWPVAQRPCNDTGNWCGPLGQVQAVAHVDTGESAEGDSIGDDTSEAEPGSACPEQFSREPYTYSLDAEATAGRMSGDCCYSYQDKGCLTN